MVWYSCLLKSFPQFVLIHTVTVFGLVNKVEVDVFLELTCFFDGPTDVYSHTSVDSVFSGTVLTGSCFFHICAWFYITTPFLHINLKVKASPSDVYGAPVNLQILSFMTIFVIS